eukprot:scaffold2250_cov399-Prasinococcus_capsulatus_cf.AAC.8
MRLPYRCSAGRLLTSSNNLQIDSSALVRSAGLSGWPPGLESSAACLSSCPCSDSLPICLPSAPARRRATARLTSSVIYLRSNAESIVYNTALRGSSSCHARRSSGPCSSQKLAPSNSPSWVVSALGARSCCALCMLLFAMPSYMLVCARRCLRAFLASMMGSECTLVRPERETGKDGGDPTDLVRTIHDERDTSNEWSLQRTSPAGISSSQRCLGRRLARHRSPKQPQRGHGPTAGQHCEYAASCGDAGDLNSAPGASPGRRARFARTSAAASAARASGSRPTSARRATRCCGHRPKLGFGVLCAVRGG